NPLGATPTRALGLCALPNPVAREEKGGARPSGELWLLRAQMIPAVASINPRGPIPALRWDLPPGVLIHLGRDQRSHAVGQDTRAPRWRERPSGCLAGCTHPQGGFCTRGRGHEQRSFRRVLWCCRCARSNEATSKGAGNDEHLREDWAPNPCI